MLARYVSVTATRNHHSWSSVPSWHQRRNTHSTPESIHTPIPIPTPTSTSTSISTGIQAETDLSTIQQLIKLLDINTAIATLKQHPEILYSHDTRMFELLCDAGQPQAVVELCEHMMEQYETTDKIRVPSFLAVCEGMRMLVDRKKYDVASRFGRLMWMPVDQEHEDLGIGKGDDGKGNPGGIQEAEEQSQKMKHMRIDWESSELCLHQLYTSIKLVAAWCDSGSPQVGMKLLREVTAQAQEHKDAFAHSPMTSKMHLFKMGCEDAMSSFEQRRKLMGAFEVVKLISLINPDLIDAGILKHLNRMLIADCSYVVSAFKKEEFPTHDLPEAAFFGRSNVGKSSLVNAVLGHDIAKVSKTPGKTRTFNFFRANQNSRSLGFFLVDLPGYGYARVGPEYREAWRQLFKAYLSERKQCRIAFQLVDVTYGILQEDRKLIRLIQQELGRRNLKHVVVFTKADLESNKPDLLEKRKQEVLACIKGLNAGKRISSDAVLFTSAKSGLGVRDLWRLIIRHMIQNRSMDKSNDGAMWEFLDTMGSTTDDKSQKQAREGDVESTVKKSETEGPKSRKDVRYHPDEDDSESEKNNNNDDPESDPAERPKPVLMTDDDPSSWKLLIAELEEQQRKKKSARMKRHQEKVKREEEVTDGQEVTADSTAPLSVDKVQDILGAEGDKILDKSKPKRKGTRTSSNAWHDFESEWSKIQFTQDENVASSSEEDDVAEQPKVQRAPRRAPTKKARRKIRNYKHLA